MPTTSFRFVRNSNPIVFTRTTPTLNDFYIEVTGDIEWTWDANNNLIANFKNIKSWISSIRYGFTVRLYMEGACLRYALWLGLNTNSGDAVTSTNPNWHKNMGGWQGGVLSAQRPVVYTNNQISYACNPAGGKSGRNDSNFSINLGQIPEDTEWLYLKGQSQFRNYRQTTIRIPVPAKPLTPPDIISVGQEADICNSRSKVFLDVEINQNEVGAIFSYDVIRKGGDFSSPIATGSVGTTETNFQVEIDLAPGFEYEIRANLSMAGYQSEYTQIPVVTDSIILPNEVVPPISEAECTALSNNSLGVNVDIRGNPITTEIGDQVEKITLYGNIQQSGTGDPSPTNYRPFTSATASIVVNGSQELVTTPIDLNSADGVYDTLDSDGNVIRRVKVITLRGNGNGMTWNVASDGNYFYSPSLMSDVKITDTIAMACTHFLPSSFRYANTPTNGISVRPSANQRWLQVNKDNTTTGGISDWLEEQYANGTPVKVILELAVEKSETTTPMDLSGLQTGNDTLVASGEMDLDIWRILW